MSLLLLKRIEGRRAWVKEITAAARDNKGRPDHKGQQGRKDQRDHRDHRERKVLPDLRGQRPITEVTAMPFSPGRLRILRPL